MRAIFAVLIGISIVLGFFSHPAAEDERQFRLGDLAGLWEGEGEVLIPKTSIPISVEGEAIFVFDSLTNRLRTEIEASKFFFTYADSGYIHHDTVTDSISWEVWDGFGRYSRYVGTIEDNVITGDKTRHGYLYRIEVDFITDDSLNFSLTTTDEDGDSRTRASINLWRKQ